jgi:hypothetical protein
MKDFRSASQQYLADKGCKSNGQKYTAFEIKDMLNEFAQEQVKNCSIPVVVGQSEQLLAFKKWEAEKCKLPWDASPEQIIEQYLSQ